MGKFEHEDKKLFDKFCKKYKYYPSILPAQKRIIAIGDLHGDFLLLIRILQLSGVINDDYEWIGGKTFVVQVGDQLDNCRPFDKTCDDPTNDESSFSSKTEPEDIMILNFLTELNEKAQKHNGAVISLLGNHEILNVMGDMKYVSYDDIEKFPNGKNNTNSSNKFNLGKEARINSFKPGNELANLLACTRMPAVIIGSFIFVHAGIINDFVKKLGIKKRNDLYKINYIVRKWLLGLIDSNNVTNIINASNISMFWDRILGAIPPNLNNNDSRCVKHLNNVLELLKVDKMIIGHTPQFVLNNEGINKTCGDKLWRIDFGGSFGFNKFDKNFNKNGQIVDLRKAQVLEILNDSEIKILKEI